MKKSKLMLIFPLLAAIALPACGTAGKDAAPGSSSASKLPDGPAETIALYKASCLNCHGTDLKGRMGPNTNLTEVGSRMTAEEILQQISHGGELMPAFKDKLSNDDIQALTDWLSGLKG
ncbi:cytochrome c [Paenibacillus pasadenensis]|uniref:c-type cytochrome n=1 Tax=Paenibacillus pasadenensis TaxID=217090 RepID=UPI0020409614|nr:cytochrome c [Paenibacillus pasadenensis]MCM3748689.1 cytochrome c [Paenibacillus pasadenensis]